MASREHYSSNGKVWVKVSTIHTYIPGIGYLEWGAEGWREKKYSITPVLWKPWTWGGYEWRRQGSPNITEVAFFRGDGERISDLTLNPYVTNQPGYQKTSVIYAEYESEGVPGISDLGNDARSVARVEVTYEWDEEERTLSAS